MVQTYRIVQTKLYCVIALQISGFFFSVMLQRAYISFVVYFERGGGCYGCFAQHFGK